MKVLRSQQPVGEGIEERSAREKRERWEASDEYKAEVEKKAEPAARTGLLDLLLRLQRAYF